MITLTCCSLAFRNDPIREVLPEIQAAGFDAVEIFGGHLDGATEEDLSEIRRQAESLNLEILAVAPYLWLTQTDELREESMRIAEKTIHQARLLGAPKIRTFTDSGPTGIGSDVATPDHWEHAVSCLKQITALAPELLFVLEMHPKTLADTETSALRVLQEVGADNLKLLFQPSRTLWIPEMRRVFPHIRHVHLHNLNAEGKPCPVETGELDLPAFLRALQEEGYAHSLSLEYCWRGPTWDQVREGMKFLNQHIK